MLLSLVTSYKYLAGFNHSSVLCISLALAALEPLEKPFTALRASAARRLPSALNMFPKENLVLSQETANTATGRYLQQC
jgi:hypothetical protein